MASVIIKHPAKKANHNSPIHTAKWQKERILRVKAIIHGDPSWAGNSHRSSPQGNFYFATFYVVKFCGELKIYHVLVQERKDYCKGKGNYYILPRIYLCKSVCQIIQIVTDDFTHDFSLSHLCTCKGFQFFFFSELLIICSRWHS